MSDTEISSSAKLHIRLSELIAEVAAKAILGRSNDGLDWEDCEQIIEVVGDYIANQTVAFIANAENGDEPVILLGFGDNGIPDREIPLADALANLEYDKTDLIKHITDYVNA